MVKDSQIYNHTEEDFSLKFDIIKIEKARQEFSNKEFKKCLEIFRTIESSNLLNDLDRKIIDFSEQKINKENI